MTRNELVEKDFCNSGCRFVGNGVGLGPATEMVNNSAIVLVAVFLKRTKNTEGKP